MAKQPESPGTRLMTEALEEFGMDPAERARLSQAAEFVDLLERVNAVVRESDLLVKGSRGQPVANPLLREQRELALCLDRLLGGLKLPAAGESQGRSIRSRSASHAARVRWGV